MHNAKPHRPGSKYNAANAALAIDTRHYPYIQFPKESPVQPNAQVQYMDEDDNLLTGTVLEDGAYLSNDIIYVRVNFGDCIEAVAADTLTKVFDYAALDTEARIVVQQKTSEIKTITRRAAHDLIDIGSKLIEVKDKLGHGNFGNWLSAEFNWSERTAQNFMRVATTFKNANFADLNFGASALHLIAAPSTPDEARQEAIERAGKGEFISHKVAQTIVSTHKPVVPAVTRPPGTEISKAYTQAVQVLEPPVKSTPITYGKPEDDFVEDVPSVSVDEEPETAVSTETVTFDIGDKVATTFGRKDGKVWNHDYSRADGKYVYVKFQDSNAFWIEPTALVLVEPAPYRKPGEVVGATPEQKEWARGNTSSVIQVVKDNRKNLIETPAAPFAHHLSGSNEWYTPKPYVDAAREVMDGITLDPASCELANKTVRAVNFYDIQADGMNKPWRGKVFLNPPYGWDEDGESNVAQWTARLVDEFQTGNIKEAILLVNATTERKWFQALWQYPICFTDHRINFYNASGEQKQPTQGNAFIYFGPHKMTFAAMFEKFGTIVQRLTV